MKQEPIIDGVVCLLEGFGVEFGDENFIDTPKRVAKAYTEILQGQDRQVLISELERIFSKSFPTNYQGLVAQKDIKAVGMCPHHLQPIKYSIDIGYIANGRALGLSKLVRISRLLAGRLVLQETLTQDIADTLSEKLNAAGVIVVVRGLHGCMTNRGVNQEVVTTTSSITGIFKNDLGARQEFIALNGKV